MVALALLPLGLERLPSPRAAAATSDATSYSLLVMGAGRPAVGAVVEDSAGQRRPTRSDGSVLLPEGGPYWVHATGFARALLLRLDSDRVLRLERAEPLDGSVRSITGAPLEGARVRGYRIDAAGQVLDEKPFDTHTGPRGRFAFENVPGGTMRLTASASEHAPQSRVLGAEARRAVDFRLEPAATLAGTVYDVHGAPAANAIVVLVGSGVWPPEQRHTDDTGRYRFLDVPPGLYELNATRGSQVAPPRSGISVDSLEHVFVPLRMQQGQRLAGRVLASDGSPIPEAEVLLTGEGLSLLPRSTATDATGAFRFDALLPGPRRLLARALHYVPAEQEVLSGDLDVELVLDRGATLRGRVLDSRDRPVASATVQWLGRRSSGAEPVLRAPASPNDLGVTVGPVPPIPLTPGEGPALPEDFGDVVTDGEGAFELTGLVPSAGQLHVSHPLYASWRGAGRALRPGDVIDDIRVVLRDGGRIVGRVVDARGFPIGDLPVELQAEDELLPRSTMALEDGTFEFDGALGVVVLTARPFTLPRGAPTGAGRRRRAARGRARGSTAR